MKRIVMCVLALMLVGCTALTGLEVKPRAMCKGWSTEISTGNAYWHVPCDNVTYADTVVWP